MNLTMPVSRPTTLPSCAKAWCSLKHWVFVLLAAVSLDAVAQAPGTIGNIPTAEDCVGFIALLPTFRSPKMLAFYEKKPDANGKELVEKIQSLADSGDKALQFTYSMLLLTGYCIPKDICAARRYLEKSRGGPDNWELEYPYPPWPKDDEVKCDRG